MGGMLSVMNGDCRVVATTWEWEEDIDAERAEAAKHRAEQALAKRRSDRQRIPYCRSRAAACAGAAERKGIKKQKAFDEFRKILSLEAFLITGNFVEISCVSLKSTNSRRLRIPIRREKQ